MAIIVLPIAKPEPLSVCKKSILFVSLSLNLAFILLAWKSPQLEQDEISLYIPFPKFCPGSQTSRSNVFLAEKPTSPEHNFIILYGNSNFFRIVSAQETKFFNSSSELIGFVIKTISTLENWCWRIIPLVSVPAAPASDLKQGVLATNLNGKLLLSRISSLTILVKGTSAVGINHLLSVVQNKSSVNLGSWPVPYNASSLTI